MSRASGLIPRRANHIQRESVLIGPVRGGSNGEAAETRTGSARVLSSNLNASLGFKVMLVGASAAAAGGYLVQVAHVDRETGATDTNWVTLGTISADGTREVEAVYSGREVGEQVKAAASVDDARVRAIRLTAGNGSNGAAAPSNIGYVWVSAF